MAKRNFITYFKELLLQFLTEADPLLSMLQWLTQQLMQMEAELKVGAEKGKHSVLRNTYFSGHRIRRFDTRLGTVYLLVPKLRKGGYIPFFVVERSFMNNVARVICRPAALPQKTFLRIQLRKQVRPGSLLLPSRPLRLLQPLRLTRWEFMS